MIPNFANRKLQRFSRRRFFLPTIVSSATERQSEVVRVQGAANEPLLRGRMVEQH